MKTKSVFIIRELDNSAKVITEGTLARDIKKAYNTHYGTNAKAKLVERMAAEVMQENNGLSITREQYETNLSLYTATIDYYSSISLLEFCKMVVKLKLQEQSNKEENK